MLIRRDKYISSQVKRRTLVPVKPLVIPPTPPEYSQRFKPRRKLAPRALACLSLTSFMTLAGLGLIGVVCAFIGLLIWPESKPVAQQSHHLALEHASLPTLTPTPGLPQARAVATIQPPPSAASNPSAVEMTVQAQRVAPPPAAPVPAATPAAPSNASVANPQPAKQVLTPIVGLNVRAGPGLDQTVLGKLAAGQAVTVVSKDPSGGWWQIEYPAGSGGQAWVSADPQYATVNQDTGAMIAQAPAVGAPAAPAANPAVVSAPAAPSVVTSAAAPVDSNSGGWSFAGTRADTIPDRKMLVLYGEMINETGATQQLSIVTGTFYDGQGQVIAADKSTYALWPVNIVPPGGHVPFALTVNDVQEAANYKLSVKSQASNTTPRQDFQFEAVNEQNKDNQYCLTGALKNPGSQLTNYVVIAAILYDDQGKVLRFFADKKTAVTDVVGEKPLDFDVCLKSPPNNVARHELLAWGS